MEENQKILELLEKMETSNRQQARLTKLMCLFALVSTLCFVAVLALVWQVLPQIEAVIPQANAVMEQTRTVLGNLEQTTQALADADLGSMVADADALVATGQESLRQTMEKLNTIDFEALNEAIQDLATVVEPMSRLANMFK